MRGLGQWVRLSSCCQSYPVGSAGANPRCHFHVVNARMVYWEGIAAHGGSLLAVQWGSKGKTQKQDWIVNSEGLTPLSSTMTHFYQRVPISKQFHTHSKQCQQLGTKCPSALVCEGHFTYKP